MDITKEGTEDGVYEATLTVQEMPIVTMYAQQNRKSNLPVLKRENTLLEQRGRMAIGILNEASNMLSGTKTDAKKEIVV